MTLHGCRVLEIVSKTPNFAILIAKFGVISLSKKLRTAGLFRQTAQPKGRLFFIHSKITEQGSFR